MHHLFWGLRAKSFYQQKVSVYIKSLFVREWEIFFFYQQKICEVYDDIRFFWAEYAKCIQFSTSRRILNLDRSVHPEFVIFLLLSCIEFLPVFNQYNMPHAIFVKPIFCQFCPKLYHFQNLKQFFWPKKERKVPLKGAHMSIFF